MTVKVLFNPAKEGAMRKVKYVKPGVVGGSSVHPC
jgi:hypothetical protein